MLTSVVPEDPESVRVLVPEQHPRYDVVESPDELDKPEKNHTIFKFYEDHATSRTTRSRICYVPKESLGESQKKRISRDSALGNEKLSLTWYKGSPRSLFSHGDSVVQFVRSLRDQSFQSKFGTEKQG